MNHQDHNDGDLLLVLLLIFLLAVASIGFFWFLPHTVALAIVIGLSFVLAIYAVQSVQ